MICKLEAGHRGPVRHAQANNATYRSGRSRAVFQATRRAPIVARHHGLLLAERVETAR